MKKYLHNIMNIRLLMIALLAIVCNTSKADDPVDGSPLNPWWDSNANAYVLRTIDSEHTALDAMKALQDINDWSDYSNYTFYLAEDVDLDGINWIPLGTSSSPFQSTFYCYKPTYGWFKGPGTLADADGMNVYPKYEDVKDNPTMQWDGAYKYTFNIEDIEALFGKNKYTFNANQIMNIAGKQKKYTFVSDDVMAIAGNSKYSFKVSDIENLLGKTKYTFNADDIMQFVDKNNDIARYTVSVSTMDAQFGSNSLYEANKVNYLSTPGYWSVKLSDDGEEFIFFSSQSKVNEINTYEYWEKNYLLWYIASHLRLDETWKKYDTIDDFVSDLKTVVYNCKLSDDKTEVSIYNDDSNFTCNEILSLCEPTNSEEPTYSIIEDFVSSLTDSGYSCMLSGDNLIVYTNDFSADDILSRCEATKDEEWIVYNDINAFATALQTNGYACTVSYDSSTLNFYTDDEEPDFSDNEVLSQCEATEDTDWNPYSYSTIEEYADGELSSYIHKIDADGNLIVVADDISYISFLSEFNYSYNDLSSYNDINEFISGELSSYFVEYKDGDTTLSFSTDKDLADFTTFSCLTPTTEPEQATYKLLPTNLGSLGYYYEDSDTSDPIYYTTDGHIGTCKISYMTINDSYDAAGFFGYVASGISLYGFTFENCSVTTTYENEDGGYAGILYGYGDSNGPSITDIFIGQSEDNLCSVSGNYAGGIFGSNADSSSAPSISSYYNISDYKFDEELSVYNPETHEGAYDNESGNSVNKIYVSITAKKYGNKISCNVLEAQNTYVYAEGISDESAFGGGTGTYRDPFIISEKQHLLNLQDILNNEEISYMSFTDLSGLDLSYDNNSSYTVFDGLYFKQTADITFTDELTAGIGIDDYLDTNTPGGPFAGYYDGGGHTIYVNISTESDHAALFANTYNATIQNLRIVGTNSSSSGYAAGIVGNQLSSSTLTLNNCIIDVKIEGSDYKCYGLIGYLDTSNYNLNLSDCFNKGANDLEIFDGADSYFADNSPYLYSWTTAYGVGTPGCPLQISSLRDLNPNSYEEEKKDMAREFIEECGLTYELTNNVILQNNKLVDPDGEYIGPDEASNEDYYIEKFCGTLIGGHYDETSSTCQTHIISGITDNALFGTITGDSKIEKIGFVNCYNASGDHSVKLAGSIESEKSLTVQECYSDGYMDLGYDTDKKQPKDGHYVIDCYSYSDIANAPIENFTKEDGYASWTTDDVNTKRMILLSNCIETNNSSSPIYDYSVNIFKKENGVVSYEETDLYVLDQFADNNGDNPFRKIEYTDAISTIPQNNMVWNTDDPRLQFKYSVNYNGEVKYMYLTDIAAVGTSTDMSDAVINSMNFDTSESYNITNIYYRRPHHNAWESVTLPFAYNLNSINENFTALDYNEKISNTASFSSINKNTTIVAGRPVLFYNADSKNTDFTAKASLPVTIVSEGTGSGTFYGVLQSTGIRGAAKDFAEGCYDQYQNVGESFSHFDMYVYKISGANTGTAEEPSGKITLCTETSWIYPFRTYLKFLPGTLAAKTITFSIFDDSTTSIDDSVVAPATQITGEVYSLDGRKISTKGLSGLKAGLYIMNGKKVMVK